MRRKYEKPQVTEVRLISDEVLLTGCKRELEVGPGYDDPSAVCGWYYGEAQACKTYSAASGS